MYSFRKLFLAILGVLILCSSSPAQSHEAVIANPDESYEQALVKAKRAEILAGLVEVNSQLRTPLADVITTLRTLLKHSRGRVYLNSIMRSFDQNWAKIKHTDAKKALKVAEQSASLAEFLKKMNPAGDSPSIFARALAHDLVRIQLAIDSELRANKADQLALKSEQRVQNANGKMAKAANAALGDILEEAAASYHPPHSAIKVDDMVYLNKRYKGFVTSFDSIEDRARALKIDREHALSRFRHGFLGLSQFSEMLTEYSLLLARFRALVVEFEKLIWSSKDWVAMSSAPMRGAVTKKIKKTFGELAFYTVSDFRDDDSLFNTYHRLLDQLRHELPPGIPSEQNPWPGNLIIMHSAIDHMREAISEIGNKPGHFEMKTKPTSDVLNRSCFQYLSAAKVIISDEPLPEKPDEAPSAEESSFIHIQF